MNIFVLHENPVLAAEYHCDKHVIKMLTETCQILCSTIYRIHDIHNHKNVKKYSFVVDSCIFKNFPRRKEIYDNEKLIGSIVHPYGLGYVNHPCNKWSYESSANFYWLLSLGIELSKQYTFRYKKIHKCEHILNWISSSFENFKEKFSLHERTEFALAMKKYPAIINKYSNDPVKAYRLFYYFDKNSFAKWDKLNNKPLWYTEIEKNKTI